MANIFGGLTGKAEKAMKGRTRDINNMVKEATKGGKDKKKDKKKEKR